MALLSPQLVARAQKLNRYYQRRLGWHIPNSPRDIGSAEFAYYVARFQRTMGTLRIDGIIGPKTWFRWRNKTWTPPVGDHLIVAGEELEVPCPVVTFEHPEGLSFYGHGGWDDRSDASGAGVDLIVLHWDVCASAHECFHVLIERGLSAHLIVDGDGTVYQTLDLADARAWHAKQVNDRSIGIEIQNPVEPHAIKINEPARPLISGASPHTGEPTTHLDFYDVQKQRVRELVEALCGHFAVPRHLPGDGDVICNSLIVPRFKGVCGHYHVSREKVDPGHTLWPVLRDMLTLVDAEPIKPEAQPTVAVVAPPTSAPTSAAETSEDSDPSKAAAPA